VVDPLASVEGIIPIDEPKLDSLDQNHGKSPSYSQTSVIASETDASSESEAFELSSINDSASDAEFTSKTSPKNVRSKPPTPIIHPNRTKQGRPLLSAPSHASIATAKPKSEQEVLDEVESSRSIQWVESLEVVQRQEKVNFNDPFEISEIPILPKHLLALETLQGLLKERIIQDCKSRQCFLKQLQPKSPNPLLQQPTIKKRGRPSKRIVEETKSPVKKKRGRPSKRPVEEPTSPVILANSDVIPESSPSGPMRRSQRLISPTNSKLEVPSTPFKSLPENAADDVNKGKGEEGQELQEFILIEEIDGSLICPNQTCRFPGVIRSAFIRHFKHAQHNVVDFLKWGFPKPQDEEKCEQLAYLPDDHSLRQIESKLVNLLLAIPLSLYPLQIEVPPFKIPNVSQPYVFPFQFTPPAFDVFAYAQLKSIFQNPELPEFHHLRYLIISSVQRTLLSPNFPVKQVSTEDSQRALTREDVRKLEVKLSPKRRNKRRKQGLVDQVESFRISGPGADGDSKTPYSNPPEALANDLAALPTDWSAYFQQISKLEAENQLNGTSDRSFIINPGSLTEVQATLRRFESFSFCTCIFSLHRFHWHPADLNN
jgi:hypothetical protein